jgi:hypothetical protein
MEVNSMNARISFLCFALAIGLFCHVASADQWGCEVLLCLSNPAGPTAVKECEPPIHRLWDRLRDGHEFPTCDMAKDGKSSAYAKLGFNFFDPCPAGMRPLARAERAILAAPTGGMRAAWKSASVSDVLTGIGDGEGYSFSDRYAKPTPLVCVGNQIGMTSISPDGRSWIRVSVYDRVTTLRPQASPRIIDVYINDALFRRVRW